MKYIAIDWYEGKEIIYTSDKIKDCLKAIRERYENTDGACCCTVEEIED